MSRQGFSNAGQLVKTLLDRHEKNPAASHNVAHIDIHGFSSVAERDAFDETLAELERSGGVDLIRKGTKTERVVTGVRLRDPMVLYNHAGRTPSIDQVDHALSALRSRQDMTDGARHVIAQAALAWTRGVTYLSIARNDVRTLGQVIDLAAAIDARAREVGNSEIDFRSFSRTVAEDSKALERNLRQVAAVLPRIYSDTHKSRPSDIEDFLASIGVRRLPQPLLLRGRVSLDNNLLPPLPYLGIPPECAIRLNLVETPAYVLTIENYTSFVRHVREIGASDSGLIIFSGGFPSRPTLAAILRLAGQARVRTFHWGDMDSGGVRIFRHLELELSAVGITLYPHMMDASLLRRVGTPARDGQLTWVGDLIGSAAEELGALIQSAGLVHEQEDLHPQSPITGSIPSLSF